MASWLPASLQQRLLRAVLSYLVILDLDSSDLDSLGIKIGKTSSVELKNVGLRVEELSKLLKLPPNLRVLSARLLSLRLTIPANFLQQSIIAEIHGIDIDVTANVAAESRDHPDDSKAPDHRKTNRRIHSPPPPLPPPPTTNGLPSTQCLAQSILLQEPEEERQDLEARYMATSLSDPGDDVGTGTSLGLPAMLTAFITGIFDRFQARIKDVNFRLSLQDSVLDVSPIVLVAHIPDINVSAAAAYPDAAIPNVPGNTRHIAVHGFSLHLLREENLAHTRTSVADLFASYAQDVPQKTDAERSTVISQSEPALAESGVLPHIQSPAHAYLSDSDHDSLPDDMTQSTASFDIRPGEDNFSWAERRSRGSSDHDQIWSSFASEDNHPASEILQDMSASVFLGTTDAAESTSTTSQSPIAQSFISAQGPQTASSSKFLSRNRQSPFSSPSVDNVVDNHVQENSTAPASQSPVDGPDLTESVVYSHAEAESMYMSAVGQEPGSPNLRMLPGGWNSVLDDDEILDPPFLSQHLDEQAGYESEDRASTPRLQDCSPVFEQPPRAEPPVPERASRSYVSREILTLHHINMSIRQTQSLDATTPDNDDVTSQSSMTASAFQQAPGAFSIYAEGGRSSFRFNAPARSDQPVLPTETDNAWSTTLEIGASPMLLQLDADTIRSFIALIQVVKGSTTPEESADEKGPVSKDSHLGLSLQLDEISVSLLEDLPETPVEFADLSTWRPSHLPNEEKKTLLQLRLKHIGLRIRNIFLPIKVDLYVGDLIFTAGTNDVLSFQHQQNHEAASNAISVEFRQTTDQEQNVRDIVVQVLPFRINFDLVRFDEDFDALGGLMGVVEMSSSLLSSGGSFHKAGVPVHPRKGVRFQESGVNLSTPMKNKFSARLQGLEARLTTKSCCLELRASTTKVLSRHNYTAVSIEKISLAMPMPNTSPGHSDFDISLGAVMMRYNFSPSEQDLGRLLSLVTPSKNKYENDDDILIHTLLQQRRKGSVLNVQVATFRTYIHGWEFLPHLQTLGDELSKLSAVTKYLPDDDTPGVLLLVRVEDTRVQIPVNEEFGDMSLVLKSIHAAQVGLPALYAVSVGNMHMGSTSGHDLVHEMLQGACTEEYPTLMARMIGDEVEPIVKVKLFNICLEYDVPTLLSLTSTETASEVEQKVQDLAASILDNSSSGIKKTLSVKPGPQSSPESSSKKLAIDVLLHDCALGLQPREMASKGVLLLKNTKFGASALQNGSFEATLSIRQSTLYIVDRIIVAPLDSPTSLGPLSQPNYSLRMQSYLLSQGYVSVSSIRSAQATITVVENDSKTDKFIDVELRDEFFLLETCADSTQTLIAVLNGLAPPAIANDDPKFRTQIDPGFMTLDDMVNSFTGEAFVKPGPAPSSLFDAEIDVPPSEEDDLMVASEIHHTGTVDFEDEDFYSGGDFPSDTVESLLEQDPFEMTDSPQLGDDALLRSLRKELGNSCGNPSNIRPFHQDDQQLDKTYGGSRALGEAQEQQKRFPIQVRVRDVNIIWNLYDGYDWRRTREAITQAVEEVEMKLEERKSSRRRSNTLDDEAETVIGDCLFNSIYIGVPSAREPADLRHSISNLINQGVDAASETESYATTGISKPSQAGINRQRKLRKKRLRLQRGVSHKIGFELKRVSLDFLIYPLGSGEVQSSVDVRVTDFEIFDHVPTSTWKKFLTLHNDRRNMREMMKPMIHLELLNVRPVPELAATEMTIRASILPLRLHVDQDALEFMTRFFDFKDDTSKLADVNAEPPFIQRLEVNTVKLCLDYKPKKVDYVGLRGGRMSEFKNFVTLEKADIKLKHAIIYGLRGFDTLHDTLSDIWTPDVIHNQLRGVLAGIGMTRPLVELGIGIRDIVAVPVAEIRRDGFKVRSVQKGAFRALSTTSSGFARLIAKVAIGTGTRLQEVEDMLSPASASSATSAQQQRNSRNAGLLHADVEDEEYEESQQRQVSNYADQPLGVLAGLHSARRYLERDLTTARDAIIAVQGDFMASGTAAGAARAVARHAPTILLQPVIGVSRAVGQTFKGVGNQVDRDYIKRSEDKYKRH